jgi:hypothetical protein
MGALGNANSRRHARKGAVRRQLQRHFSSPDANVSGMLLHRCDSLAPRRTHQDLMSEWICSRFAMSRKVSGDVCLVTPSSIRSGRISALVGGFSHASRGRVGVRNRIRVGACIHRCNRVHCRRSLRTHASLGTLSIRSGRRCLGRCCRRRCRLRCRLSCLRCRRCLRCRSGRRRGGARRSAVKRFGNIFGLAGMRIALMLVPADAAFRASEVGAETMSRCSRAICGFLLLIQSPSPPPASSIHKRFFVRMSSA